MNVGTHCILIITSVSGSIQTSVFLRQFLKQCFNFLGFHFFIFYLLFLGQFLILSFFLSCLFGLLFLELFLFFLLLGHFLWVLTRAWHLLGFQFNLLSCLKCCKCCCSVISFKVSEFLFGLFVLLLFFLKFTGLCIFEHEFSLSLY